MVKGNFYLKNVINTSCSMTTRIFVIRFALELHMVHHDKRYESLARAAQEKNGIAVLGILFHATDKPNPIIEKFLQNSHDVFNAAGKNVTYKDPLLLSELLPQDKGSYFRYEGSLTTPCKD